MCNFINNSANMGGAILWRSFNGSIVNSIFDGNTAELGNTFTRSKDVDVVLTKNYWAINASTVDDFKKYKFVTYYDKYDNESHFEVAYAPNSWVLMSIYNKSEIIYGKNAKFYIALDTVTDGINFNKIKDNFLDYTTSLNINDKKHFLLKINSKPTSFNLYVDTLKFKIIAKSPITGLIESYFIANSSLINNDSNKSKNFNSIVKIISMENTGNSLVLFIISLLILPVLRRKL